MPINHVDNHPNAIPPQAMDRRTLLMLCAPGAVPGLLAACGTEATVSVNVTSTPTSRPSHTPHPHTTKPSSPTPQPSPTDADWSALASNLRGTLIRPGNSQYPVAHQLFNPRFDGILPAAIAYCSSLADVQTCLSFVQRFGLPFTPRSGGHSYAGYSTTTGLILDITSMSPVAVNAGTGVATVGAGARLIHALLQARRPAVDSRDRQGKRCASTPTDRRTSGTHPGGAPGPRPGDTVPTRRSSLRSASIATRPPTRMRW